MESVTISLLGPLINNVANIPHGSVIDYSNIRAYSVNNGIVEEYSIGETYMESMQVIRKDKETIGTLHRTCSSAYINISVGLLMDHQDIQLVVDVPYEANNGL